MSVTSAPITQASTPDRHAWVLHQHKRLRIYHQKESAFCNQQLLWQLLISHGNYGQQFRLLSATIKLGFQCTLFRLPTTSSGFWWKKLNQFARPLVEFLLNRYVPPANTVFEESQPYSPAKVMKAISAAP